jgi:hypothetical protein
MPSGMIMRYVFQLEFSFLLLSDLRISKISIPVFYRRAPSLLSQTCHPFTHEFFCHPSPLHLNASPIGSFFFWKIISLQNSSKWYQFPLIGHNWKHHIILKFSCPVWTSTNFEPFVSFVVLVCISWKLGFPLHYPFVLRGNHVFSSDLFYGIGVLLFFRGSLWTAFVLV